jgi:hypothetical protein
MNGSSVMRLRDIIPRSGCQSGLPDGRWVIAVPFPPPINRLKAAWAVLSGRAYAVEWPRDGEFEQAMVVNGYEVPR